MLLDPLDARTGVSHLPGEGEGAGDGVVGRRKYAFTISRTDTRVMRSMTAPLRALSPMAASRSAQPLVPSSACMYTSTPSRTKVRMLAVLSAWPSGVPDQAHSVPQCMLSLPVNLVLAEHK